MKGLILSGGHGTRLRPLTYSQQKQLIPVANKPVLFYAIEDVIEAGAEDIGIIYGPNKEQVINTVESGDWPDDVTFEFIHQPEPKGIAHTILVAEEAGFLGDESFVLYLGDNILREGIVRHTNHFQESDPDASIMLMEVDNPEQFGIADLNDDGSISELVEKPDDPPSNLALVGIYFFKPVIHDAVKNIDYSWRDELEITHAIQWLVDNGYRVEYTKIEDWWKDTGKPEDILHANRLVLDDIEKDITGKIDSESRVEGRVNINENVEVINSIIKGPVTIGSDTVIKNSYIGPYTSLGPECKIKDTEITDSVVLDQCKINNSGRIVESLLGKEVKIDKKEEHPQGNKFVMGDRSQIELK